MLDPYEYFPGDPAYPETFFLLAGMALVVASLPLVPALLFGWARYAGAPRILRRTTFVLAPLPIVTMVVCASFVGARHFGPWAQLKAIIAEEAAAYSAHLAEHPPAGDRWPIIESFGNARGPRLFRFTPEHAPVRVYAFRSIWPYVAVDFGHGANAVFDPRTMIVLVSD